MLNGVGRVDLSGLFTDEDGHLRVALASTLVFS
jgi:hypothetical protein